jgi:hypothetical protein
MMFTPGQPAEMPEYSMPPLHMPLPVTVLGPCVCQFDPHPEPRYVVADPWGSMICHVREDSLRTEGAPGWRGITLAGIEAARAAYERSIQ